MTSAELRDRFLAFFKRANHTIVPSDSLIPSGDATVLFTSAGMNQFKDYFLGKRTDVTRAASCQKCLRTGDLENVGKTPSHHSFFEMLGNFSFGDYFKAQAIAWAWEFLTGTLDYAASKPSTTPDLCLRLPTAKLWVSMYEEDVEAAELWRQLGLPESRIKRFGQEDNFWPANAPKDGPNGPCGPCSEIYFDPEGKVEGPKSVEVWNLVFTQYDRQPDGRLTPLPKPNIDTGMGLERLTRVIQGVHTDYETDVFAPIMNAIQQLPRGKKVKPEQVVFAERAIADHLRAAVFLITDGVLPSNESRGYILRMLIRRASRLGLNVLNVTERAFLSSLASSVETAMKGSPYSAALAEKRAVIQRVLEQEEDQFLRTLDSSIPVVEAAVAVAAKGTNIIPGGKAFEFYDTYGIPLELTVDIAGEQGVMVDREGFTRALQEQQQRSRKASQFGGEVFTPTTMSLKDVPKSEFLGYESLQADGTIKGIWKGGAWAQQAAQGDEVVGIVLDQSPFYGEAGGQIGDQGTLEASQGAADVVDTTWVDELLVHRANITRGALAVGAPVRAMVNAERRLKIARSHTGTHLLHWALRNVLGPEAVQAGSFVDTERIRFDFSALSGLKDEQWATVEQLVNGRIRNADEVRTDVMDLERARQEGALALFGEKYGRNVRVVSIGDYSKEFCGGTHLRHTGSVGLFRLVSESSIAAGTRRVEAVVGQAAMDRQQEESRVLRQIAQQLSRAPADALQGLEELMQQLKTTERQLKSLKMEFAQAQAGKFVAQAKHVDGVTLVAARMDGADREVLAALADAIKQAVSNGVTVLASKERQDAVAWVMSVSPALVKRGLHAGQMLKAIAAETGGSGGGRPEFAQAGGKDPSRIPQALSRAEELVRQALEKRS